MLTQANVVKELLDRVPEFNAVYEGHLHDNEGEALQHLLIAELLRFTFSMYRLSVAKAEESSHAVDTIERILCFVEDAALSGDERVVELVQVSYMENLHQAGPYYHAISSRLKPASRNLLAAVEQGWERLGN